METEIMEVLRKGEELTPAAIANILNADISVVEGRLSCMEKSGKLQTVTWEKVLWLEK